MLRQLQLFLLLAFVTLSQPVCAADLVVDGVPLPADASVAAAVPGSAFGAEGYLRLSYATSDEIIQKGVTRLAAFCASLKK